jgi:hypothetical protein
VTWAASRSASTAGKRKSPVEAVLELGDRAKQTVLVAIQTNIDVDGSLPPADEYGARTAGQVEPCALRSAAEL